jgi:hypothetical protein
VPADRFSTWLSMTWRVISVTFKSEGSPAERSRDATKGVRIASIDDPDGNTVNFIGGFRVEY